MKCLSLFCYLVLSLLSLSTSAYALYADQDVIKHESEVTGDLHRNSSTNEEFILYPKGLYVHHIHVNTAGVLSFIWFFETDTLPCGDPDTLVAKMSTNTIGAIDLTHRFNHGACVKTTGTSPATLSIHYFIGG